MPCVRWPGVKTTSEAHDVCDVKTAATRRLRIYNGSGVIFAMGNLDYMLDVVRTETRCYTLLI